MGYVMNETKAGRELDRAIAEKVMGRKVTWDAPDVLLPGPPDNDAPNYSTSIDAAWEVVEKLRNWPGGHWWLHLWQVAGVREEWRASFTFGGMAAVHPKLEATANTAPLAICLAALKAMGKP